MSDRVMIHPDYGRGVVRRTRHGGFELEIQFEAGLLRWVRLDMVQDAWHLPSTLPAPPFPTDPGLLKPRRMIESFRLGIVPDDSITEFTFGRDQEVAAIKQWLESPDEPALIVLGSYGSGKTHLLNFVRSYAIHHGFAVSLVETDPQETPFARPKRVYREVARNLRFRPASQAPMEDFQGLVKRAVSSTSVKDHRYFRHLRGPTSDENLWSWIEAREDVPRPPGKDPRYTALPGLYKDGNAANIYCNLLSTLGWATTQRGIGLGGLVLLFDEAESIYQRRTATAEEQSYSFLDALIMTARNDPALRGLPYESGIDYWSGWARDVPFLAHAFSGLKVLLAFTTDYDFDRSRTLPELPTLCLQPLDRAALDAIFDKVVGLYAQAYDFIPDPGRRSYIQTRVLEAQLDASIRMVVKGYVEALDILRFHPDVDLKELL